MLPDEAVVRALSNDFVPVMWKYDGLNGEVIAWTKAHGNTSDDPAHRLWILDADGKEVAHAAGEGESPSGLVDWLANGLLIHARAKTPGIAHLFDAPADGVDPVAPGPTGRVVWYATTDADDAPPERRAAAARSKTLGEKLLASKKLEAATKGLELWRIDATPTTPDGALDVSATAALPRIVVLGPASADGKEPLRVELSGPTLTLDALVAALGRLPKVTATGAKPK